MVNAGMGLIELVREYRLNWAGSNCPDFGDARDTRDAIIGGRRSAMRRDIRVALMAFIFRTNAPCPRFLILLSLAPPSRGSDRTYNFLFTKLIFGSMNTS